jgi:hypothetical protein
MYGLPQAGILANEVLQCQLALDGYRPTEDTHGLWKHKTRPIWFSLVEDDFGIQYIGRNNAEHLMASIKKNDDISSDWTGSAYCGLKIDWNYINGTVYLSIPGYIKAELHKYQHPEPTRPEHAPHQWNPPIYCAKTQYVEDTQDSLRCACSHRFILSRERQERLHLAFLLVLELLASGLTDLGYSTRAMIFESQSPQ